MNQITRTSSCQCGKVRMEAIGEPILAAVCYCDDCQAGARKIEALPDAPKVLDEDCGSSYMIYRDDRISVVAGEELLEAHKLKDKTPTRRWVATCCNSAIYLKYKPGHWVSSFRNRYEGDDLPPVTMRTNTRFRESDLPYPDAAPTYRGFPMSLIWKVVVARFAMWFGR